MSKNHTTFEVPGSSIDFQHLTGAPIKPLPRQPHLPNSLRSINKAFHAVCFCCLATDVPLTNAKKCSHKDFVNIYLLLVPSIPLLICNICHHMLKKIEDFRLQIQNNFENLMSMNEPDERHIFVNDLSRKPTISILSLKPSNITSIDPLSVSTADLVDPHEAFSDDNLADSGICSEEPMIKTEPYDADTPNTIIPENTSNTNTPGSTRYYIELKPNNNIKQEMDIPQNQLEKSNKNPLKSEALPITTNTSPLFPTPMKQSLEKRTNKYLVNLLNSVNKPLNLQKKPSEKDANTSVTDENAIRTPDIDLDDCYEGKINTIILTEAEFLKQREKERIDESFLKSKYKCESCKEGFEYEMALNKHNKRFHTKKDNPIECKFCKKRYMYHHTLDRHLEKHLVRYICLVCNKQSNNLYALTEHYNVTHLDKEPIQKTYACKDCAYVTYYKARFNNHKHRRHKTYVCKICNKKLNGYGSYKYHMKYVHDHDDDKDIKEKNYYKCDECPASYTHFTSLKSHKKTRHVIDGKPEPVYCQPCDKFLTSKFTYREHLRHSAAHKHENNYLKFECDHCHDKFPLKRSLKLHIERQHLNIFNHKCNICNKLCVHDQALAKHIMTVHEKKRPPKTDVCHVCGKVYCSKEVLKKHMRIHTGERPHACNLCGMTFTQSSTLATHKKLKHKIPKKNEVLKENTVASSSWGIQ